MSFITAYYPRYVYANGAEAAMARSFRSRKLKDIKIRVDRFWTGMAWRSLFFGAVAVLLGPFLGFGLFGLMFAIAAVIFGMMAMRKGEQSLALWSGLALAAIAAFYVPSLMSQYP